ncbi:uncharacterized protein LOC143749644 [Siphateles boraxobius]|uniref:uncharacterized protein LOC143749644 n=1 Tax=Siphateles boraxobius TaxID=180520 RepID=UPI0040630A11
MNNISVFCGEIKTDEEFVFKLPSDLLNRTLNGDCEQSWLAEDGRLIAHPSDPETLSYPGISVLSDRLITSRCVNLNHEIICDTPGSHHSHKTMFRVWNTLQNTTVTTNSDVLNEVNLSLEISDQLWWLCVLFIFIIIIIICFILRKRIFRCFQREARPTCQTDDETDNRDLKVGSDDPYSPQESETVHCVQMMITYDALNQHHG